MTDLDLLGVLFAKYVQKDKRKEIDLVAMKFLCDRLLLKKDEETVTAVSEVRSFLENQTSKS